MREYVLVAPDKVRVEHYMRKGDLWVLTEISDSDGTLHLASVGCIVVLAEIYEIVEFDPLAIRG